MKNSQRFLSFAQRELQELEADVILKNGSKYQVFGKYTVTPDSGKFLVHCQGIDVGQFETTRSALSYCIADNRNNLNLARQILDLDQKLQYNKIAIAQRRAFGEKTQNFDLKELSKVKIQHRQQQQHWLRSELEKCIKMAKYLHHKGFSNETERTGRTASHKVYR